MLNKPGINVAVLPTTNEDPYHINIW